MKPFNLEEAKEGKPVVTRERKIRRLWEGYEILKLFEVEMEV